MRSERNLSSCGWWVRFLYCRCGECDALAEENDENDEKEVVVVVVKVIDLRDRRICWARGDLRY